MIALACTLLFEFSPGVSQNHHSSHSFTGYNNPQTHPTPQNQGSVSPYSKKNIIKGT